MRSFSFHSLGCFSQRQWWHTAVPAARVAAAASREDRLAAGRLALDGEERVRFLLTELLAVAVGSAMRTISHERTLATAPLRDEPSEYAPPPENTDGRSITPLLSETPPSAWRTALLNESRLVKPEDQTSPNYEAIFTASGERCVEHATDEKELYDLKTDPYELTNSYDAAAPPTSLASRLRALEKCAGETCRKAENGQ